MPSTDTLIAVCTFLILLSSNVYFAVTNRKSQKLGDQTNAMILLQGEVAAQRSRGDKLESDFHEQGRELAGLKATIAEKDSQLQMFKEIFQNKNPEMMELLKDIKSVLLKVDAKLSNNTTTINNQTT